MPPLFYALALIAGLVFAFGLLERLTFIWAGKGAPTGLAGRLTYLLRPLASRAFLADLRFAGRFRRAPVRRVIHLCIFGCFLGLFFIGSLGDLVARRLEVLAYRDIPWFALVNDAMGIVLVVALLFALLRRVRRRPDDLKPSRQGTVFIALLLLVAASGFFVEGLRLATTPPDIYDSRFSFVGSFLAPALAGNASTALFEAMWWAHAVLSLTLLAYLPYSHGLHIFLAPLSLALSQREEVKDLCVSEDEPRFSFKQRLQLEACVRCSECVVSCEVVRAGDLPTGRLLAADRFAPQGKIDACKTVLKTKRPDDDLLTEFSQGVFDCTLCGRCNAACPVRIDTRGLMLTMREDLVARGAYPSSLDMVSETIAAEHNVLGFPNDDRTLWLDFLDDAPEGLDAKEKAETLYYVGCMSSFSPAIQEIPQALTQVMHKAGEDFAVLAGREWCCGFPLIVAGRKTEARALMEHNIQQLRSLGARRVVFNCPSCYYTWKHYYRADLLHSSESISLMHETEYFAELVRTKRLSFDASENEAITYHDPCDLGRGCGVYEPPREIVRRLGDFRELSENREHGFCCGGGGDLEMYNADLGSKINHGLAAKIRETKASTVVSACPQCKRMLLRSLNESGDAVVKDVAELVLEKGTFRLQGEKSG